MEKQQNKRLVIIGGVVAVVAVCFVAGYIFGTRGTSLPANPLAAMGSGGTSDSDPHAMPTGMNGAAPSLADLLPGLEAKVKANPKDMDQRMLLAQTYNELARRDDAIKTLRAIHRDQPSNTRATILLATTLIDSNAKRDLNDAFALLDDAARRKPAVEVMARLYQGDIRAKLGDANGAQAIWRKELSRLPADDPRRNMYETKLAQVAPVK